MNKNIILATVFLLAGTLITTVVATAPTADAEGKDHKEKKYREGYDRDGNKVKAQYHSEAGLVACDKNYIIHSYFKCEIKTLEAAAAAAGGDGGAAAAAAAAAAAG